ncbi:hypothetical protein GORHZ_105_00140, partial [Gordonia rhizosphera NBRC 16068]
PGSPNDPTSPNDSTSHDDAPRSRRERVRADLRSAGTGSGTRQRFQIGSGPGTESTSEQVRNKLSERYGG